jgi:hypothetical protein
MFELHMAARREEGEAGLDLPFNVLARAAQERLEAAVETELPSVLAHKVKDEAPAFSTVLSESAAELLKEQRRAVRRAEQQERVNVWEVDALVEEVDREEHVDLAAAQVVERSSPLIFRAVAPDGRGWHARVLEDASHEAGMLDVHAEA